MGVKQKFECDGAVVILKHGSVVVANGLDVPHRNQKTIVHTGMGHVAEKAGQEARHDIQIAEDLHQLACLNEVVEVASQLNDLDDVVVRVLVVRVGLDGVQQVQKV